MGWSSDLRGAPLAGRLVAAGLVALLVAMAGGALWAAGVSHAAFVEAQVAARVSMDYQEACHALNLEAGLIEAYYHEPTPAARAQFAQAGRALSDALARAVSDDRASSDRGVDDASLATKILAIQRQYVAAFGRYAAAVDAGDLQNAGALEPAMDASLAAMQRLLAGAAGSQEDEALAALRDEGAVQDRVEVGTLLMFAVGLGLVVMVMLVQRSYHRREIAHAAAAAEALRRSDERFRTFVEAMPVGAVLTGPQGQILMSNRAALEMLGLSEEQLAGKTALDAAWQVLAEDGTSLPPDALPPFTVARTGEPVRDLILGIARPAAGGHVWVQGTALPQHAADGGLQGVISTFIDVTARRQAEEDRLRFFTLALDLLCTAGFDGHFQDLNPAFQGTLGYTPAELRAAPLWHFIHHDDQAAASAAMRTLATGAPIGAFESRFRCKDGSYKWLQWRAIPFPDRRLIYAAARDISEQKRAEAEYARLLAREQEARAQAERSEANLRAIIDAAPLPIVTLDAATTVRSWNAAAERVFGWDAAAVVGQPLPIVPREERQEREALLARLRTGGPVQGVEVRRQRKDGSQLDMMLSLAPFQAATGQEGDLVGLYVDITPQKQAEQRIRRQVERLSALRTIDIAITAGLDLRLTLGILLDQVLAQLGVHAAAVLLLNAHTQTLEYAAGRGFHGAEPARTGLRLGEGLAGRAGLERRLIGVRDLSQERPLRGAPTAEEGAAACFAAPLIAKGELKGVLEVCHREPLQPEPDWTEFLEALAGQAAIAIDNASLFEHLQRSNCELSLAYDTTIEGWARALDLRDKETEGHSRRVTEMTLVLARALGVGEGDMAHVRRGALLHDIGKMGIPDAILLKPGKLTEEEWEIMRRHPTYAHELLAPIAYLRPALDIPYCHHEKWDGTGYPRGLRGEAIPLAARVFAVVDIWDALRSDRPYRAAWPEEEVREHIRALAGTHLDPRVVRAFLDPGVASPANPGRHDRNPGRDDRHHAPPYTASIASSN